MLQKDQNNQQIIRPLTTMQGLRPPLDSRRNNPSLNRPKDSSFYLYNNLCSQFKEYNQINKNDRSLDQIESSKRRKRPSILDWFKQNEITYGPGFIVKPLNQKPQMRSHKNMYNNNENYDIEDPVHIRNYPQRQIDPDFEQVKNRERALHRTKPFSAEIKTRAIARIKLQSEENNSSDISDAQYDSMTRRVNFKSIHIEPPRIHDIIIKRKLKQNESPKEIKRESKAPEKKKQETPKKELFEDLYLQLRKEENMDKRMKKLQEAKEKWKSEKETRDKEIDRRREKYQFDSNKWRNEMEFDCKTLTKYRCSK